MPSPTDHDERRRAVAEIALRLVADAGIEAVTVRNVAKAAGYSTAGVSHYFRDKRDLLLTYRAAARRAQARFDAALQSADPLLAFLEAILPLDDERHRDWQAWCAFWGSAIADAEFATEQSRRTAYAAERLAELLRTRRRRAGRAPRDAALEARRLLALAMGIATQAAFDPKAWPPARQRRCIADEVAGL